MPASGSRPPTFTTAQPAAGSPESQRLTRVAWRVNGAQLTRVTWQVLDRYLESPEYPRVLVENVEDLAVQEREP